MEEEVTAGAAPLLTGLPDDIVVSEILVRLPPKSLLRCRTVGRAWRRNTSTREFLLGHHGLQPPLPIVRGCGNRGGNRGHTQNILAFDSRSADARLQPVARLDNNKFFYLEASCDGLLILSVRTSTSLSFSVCNPATRQHAPLRQPDFTLFHLLGMYLHRPSGEYRLLMYRMSNSVEMSRHLLPEGEIGCYLFTVGSDLPPRCVGGAEAGSALAFLYDTPALVRDCLHWSPVPQPQSESNMVIVLDTTAESFRQMRAPAAPKNSSIFEMYGTLGIYSYKNIMKVVDIWVLRNYEGEVWEHKYGVELPVTEIRGHSGREGRWYQWYVSVVSADGDILLLLNLGKWLFYVDIDGRLVDSFHRDGQQLCASRFRFKQTPAPHTFFTPVEDYDVNTSRFV